MRVFKPLTVTKVNNTVTEYSDGHHTVSVAIDQAESADFPSAYDVYHVTWPNGDCDKISATPNRLYEIIQQRLLSPLSNPFTAAQFDVACAEHEHGRLAGIIAVELSWFDAYDLKPTLIRALVDLGDITVIKLVSYEIVGFEDQTVFIMVVIEKKDPTESPFEPLAPPYQAP